MRGELHPLLLELPLEYLRCKIRREMRGFPLLVKGREARILLSVCLVIAHCLVAQGVNIALVAIPDRDHATPLVTLAGVLAQLGHNVTLHVPALVSSSARKATATATTEITDWAWGALPAGVSVVPAGSSTLAVLPHPYSAASILPPKRGQVAPLEELRGLTSYYAQFQPIM